MYEFLRTRVLRLLRVPHDPDPPAGAPGSVRVFRASRNFYTLRLFTWGLGQVGALIGIVVSLSFLDRVQDNVDEVRFEVRQTTGAAPPVPTDRSGGAVQAVAGSWPSWFLPVITFAEWAGVLLYLIQIPVTYAIVRLDYEMRWYIVTDRSLRIRAGVASVQETTMSFANVQQVAVSQGPLQRLLGIADLRVQSAGGGGGDRQDRGHSDSLHSGIFHGVDNAGEIRDLIQERLRAFRQAGLGDPDDVHVDSHPREPAPPLLSSDASAGSPLAAARDVLREVRALRQAFNRE